MEQLKPSKVSKESSSAGIQHHKGLEFSSSPSNLDSPEHQSALWDWIPEHRAVRTTSIICAQCEVKPVLRELGLFLFPLAAE
jgi:hypothetical protein